MNATARRRATRRRAFTLVETVTAMAISTILLLAMASTIVVAAQAVPTGDEAVITEGAIERGVALIESDIEVATAVSWSTTLELTVADRDGDRADDVITYDWTSGDRMLTRYRNGEAAEELFGPIAMGNVVLNKDGAGNTDHVIIVFVLADHTPPVRIVNVRVLNRPAETAR
ncbi:MAG: prepilin-type N-terminal cleavage/methylation domain-containing protein [Planctomycetota bacterium]